MRNIILQGEDMNKELAWMLLGPIGLLSQFGGTWWKSYRRHIIPVMSVAWAWFFVGFFKEYIPMAIHLALGFTNPITKFGDSIPNDWRNWLWLPFWGVFVCSSALWLNWHYWPVCLICGLLLATLVALSNIKATARWFPWKMVELFEGILPIMPLCYFITLQP